ncbi:DUF1963 domain-containing protein [Streptomyces sp. NPDC048483]|uniref:DUF1963 domain-containing protein n=1 Tax=Streptomyces sp. NPDC048483 TaxID=3154927 RepID=UPI003446B573
MTRPGFGLKPAREDRPATGRCRWGGPALLEPGTDWPEREGLPLSLIAVLDTQEPAPWLGEELPVRPGLLNFFYAKPDTGSEEALRRFRDMSFGPGMCRVIPADPVRAGEREAPPLAEVFDPVPLHAHPVVTLPEAGGCDVDPALNALDLGSRVEESLLYPLDAGWFVHDHFADVWTRFRADEQTLDRSDQAFGWTPFVQPTPVHIPDREKNYRHLLTVSTNGLWDWHRGSGSLHFVIPEEALREGDFTQALPDTDTG